MSHINFDFNSCAASLREIRTQLADNLEPSIVASLDSVIERLENGSEAIEDGQMSRELCDEALSVLARIVELTIGITALVNQFHG